MSARAAPATCSAARGRELTLVQGGEPVRRLFEVSGTLRLLPFLP
jgi:hypothetical protein